MWTPDSVGDLIQKTIIAYYTASIIYTILMGIVLSMIGMTRDDEDD